MLRRFYCAGGLMLTGAALLLAPVDARADDHCDDSCFAFFRRCPPESGVQTNDTALAHSHQIFRPHRCPPYCDPTFGYYPTAWRSWPSLCYAVGEDFESAPAPKTVPKSPSGTATPPGGAPPVMPPAAEGDAAWRRPANPGLSMPTVRSPAELPAISDASVR